MQRAFIKLNKKTFDSFVWLDNNNGGKYDKWSAYCDLLYLADYKAEIRFHNGLGKMMQYERGTVYKSIQQLSYRWNWDRKTVRKFLSDLQKAGMVETYISSKFTRIKMLWYDNADDEIRTEQRTVNSLDLCGDSDNPWTEKRKEDGQQNARQVDSRTDTFKKEKKENKGKEEIYNMVIPMDDRAIDYGFDELMKPRGISLEY